MGLRFMRIFGLGACPPVEVTGMQITYSWRVFHANLLHQATRQHAEQVLKDFGDWLRSAECARRFVIAGNHDFWLEETARAARAV